MEFIDLDNLSDDAGTMGTKVAFLRCGIKRVEEPSSKYCREVGKKLLSPFLPLLSIEVFPLVEWSSWKELNLTDPALGDSITKK